MQGTQYATKRSILCMGAFCGPQWIFFAIFSYLCYAILSVHCSFVIICWERADLLALLCVFFFFFFFFFDTILYGVSGQLWYLIVLIPDRCFFCTFITQLYGVYKISQCK